MKKLALFILLIVSLLGAAFLLSRKKDETETDGAKNGEAALPPKPPTPPQGGQQSGSNSPTSFNTANTSTSAAVDPNVGAGRAAIENFAADLHKTGNGRKLRLRDKNGANIFAKTHQNVSGMLEAMTLGSANAPDVYGLDLVPSFVDGGEFRQKLEKLLNICQNPANSIENNGRKQKDGFRTFVAWLEKQADFRDVSNFAFITNEAYVRDEIIDPDNSGGRKKISPFISPLGSALARSGVFADKVVYAGGYGDAGGSEQKRFEHYKAFLGSELKSIVSNMLSALTKYESALLNESKLQLTAAGWNFIGYK